MGKRAMSERKTAPSKTTIDRQRQASNPNISAWVEANAGSGKTHVLTQRVVRLLLNGTNAQNLLCLTYTKAAAAEMRARVADILAHWAVLSDKELSNMLFELNETPPDEKLLLRARTLFAHALETPGGLKINTIHAFCESLLHRFSLEANVPVGFSVIEELEQTKLIMNARDEVLAKAILGQGEIAKSVKKLFSLMSDTQIENAISLAISKGTELSVLLANIDQAKADLRAIMHHDGVSAVDLQNDIVNGTLLNKKDVKFTIELLNGDPSKSKRFVDILAQINMQAIDCDLLVKAFLTEKGTIRATLLPKKQREQFPELQVLFEREAERLCKLNKRLKIARIVERSSALIDVLGAIYKIYNKEKRKILALDYADLIEKTRTLLTNAPSMEWVLYKLDANISHILVDESQDTNPEQWAVVSRLWDDFFAGKSAVENNRTIFAVGDKKQSIFSFQGAKPELFANTGYELKKRAKNVKKTFIQSELKTSFRTLENILSGVDRVFQSEGLENALLSNEIKIEHESARTDSGGSITLWPVIAPKEIALEKNQWPIKREMVEGSNNERVVAKIIVDNIANWLKNKRALAQRGRAVRADDILILLQSRKGLFHEIIRALKLANIPTPGSDRLSLSTHIGVLDLLALADILLNPSDDLTLATILRSPLFDISESQLYELAANRPKNTSLWQALARSKNEVAIDVYKKLSRWRSKLDFERPYEFFSSILYKEGGLKLFHARLGYEVDDVFAQFLDLALAHEHENEPSLLSFIANMRNSDISIKRELAEQGNGVRIMSIHGAKGLEAPIVILADSASPPSNKSKAVHIISTKRGATLIHASSEKERIGAALVPFEQDKASERAEYWRKLYVGMTRAEDELYLTGTLNKNTKLEQTWYGIVKKALKKDSEDCEIINSDEKGLIYPRNRVEPTPIKQQALDIERNLIDFSAKIAPKAQEIEIVNPSLAYENEQEIFATSATKVIDAQLARKKGIALHALLQHLVTIKPELRPTIANKALNVLLSEHKEWHDELANKAIKILSNPQNKYLFGANSRAETAFLVDGLRDGKKISIAGRIDRIIIEQEKVLLVDFKSDGNVVDDISQIPPQYITQMGLYYLVGKRLFPNNEIKSAIFWTEAEKITYLPQELLLDSVSNFTLDL